MTFIRYKTRTGYRLRRRRNIRRAPKRRMRNLAGYNFGKYKIRYLSNVTSDGLGVFDQVLSTSDPEGAVDSAGVYNDWTQLEALWDSYKVTGLSIKYIPNLPNNISSSTAFQPLYLVQDSDDIAALTASSEALQYEKFKVKNLYKPFSVYYRVKKKVVSGNPIGWLNIGAAGSTTNRISSIKTYADNLTSSTVYGQFILTMYIKCMGKR